MFLFVHVDTLYTLIMATYRLYMQLFAQIYYDLNRGQNRDILTITYIPITLSVSVQDFTYSYINYELNNLLYL
jgi:hypothetical protein